MSNLTIIESVRFETEKLDHIESGVDFREITRLYDSAVVGEIYLYLDGDEVLDEGRFPNEYNISGTVKAMFEMSSEFMTTGSVTTHPFCCICGDRGCAYIRWQLDTVDAGMRLKMEDVQGDPIGAHEFHLQPETLCSAIAKLAETVVATMDKSDRKRTTAGTILEFANWKEQLSRWSGREA